MKAISPLDQNDQARTTWEQGQAAAERAQPQAQPSHDPAQVPEAVSPGNELPLKPVDMSSIYPTFDVTSHTPPSTGSVSHEGMAQPKSLALDKRPWWVAAGVYLLAGLQLLSLVQLFLSGSTPSLIDAIGAIITGALAFGLLSWRQTARKIYLVLAVLVIGGTWFNVYRIDASMRSSQTRFEAEVMRLESRTPSLTSQEQRELDQLQEKMATTHAAYGNDMRPKIIRIAIMTTAVPIVAVVFLFLPRVRSEFS